MFEPVKIAPSILSADFMNLGRDIALIEEAGAGYVHVDVMDGHFVPNLTMGVPIVRQLKKATALPLDVHLMIDNPLEQLPWFLDAGADLVTVHAEVLDADGLARAVASIHAAGAKAAVSLKPVSYTHLDVYKRQAFASSPRPEGFPFAPTTRWLGTMTGSGFLLQALPTARHERGLPMAAARSL